MISAPARIVIDTNVLISAGLLPHSLSALALTKAVSCYAIAQNELTWFEFESRIQRPKFDRYFGELGRLSHLAAIAKHGVHVARIAHVAESRDPDDDKFIALAVDSGARIVLTGDKDLLALHPFNGIQIVSARDFLQVHT